MNRNHNVELIMFPDVPDSTTFDITLMITLLRNLTSITPPNSGYDCLPSANETRSSADLARIKYYRNFLAHLNDGKLESADFNKAWYDISWVGTPNILKTLVNTAMTDINFHNHHTLFEIRYYFYVCGM